MNLQEFKDCLNLITEEKQNQLKSIIGNYHNIMILGNGGSNAVSSHVAEDYTKTLGKRAMAFSDAATLSCYANDYGWENAYKMYATHYLLPDSLLILISSSGKSKNILNTAEYAAGNYPMITLSGFDPTNTLKTNFEKHSLMHFYVPSNDYGIVEIMHNLILHSVI